MLLVLKVPNFIKEAFRSELSPFFRYLKQFLIQYLSWATCTLNYLKIKPTLCLRLVDLLQSIKSVFFRVNLSTYIINKLLHG